MGSRLTSKTKNRLWLLGFFLGPLLANPGSFLIFLLLAGALGAVVGPGFIGSWSDAVVGLTVALFIVLAWASARLALRAGAPSGIWVAATMGSALSAFAALQDAYNLLKPLTPDMVAEPSIAEAVRGAALFGLWVYGALAVGIPVAVFLAARQSGHSGLGASAAGTEQAHPADGVRCEQQASGPVHR